MKKAAKPHKSASAPDTSEFHEQYGDGRFHYCSRRLTAAEQEFMRYNGVPDDGMQNEDTEDAP